MLPLFDIFNLIGQAVGVVHGFFLHGGLIHLKLLKVRSHK
jgi:hypothetical protein